MVTDLYVGFFCERGVAQEYSAIAAAMCSMAMMNELLTWAMVGKQENTGQKTVYPRVRQLRFRVCVAPIFSREKNLHCIRTAQLMSYKVEPFSFKACSV